MLKSRHEALNPVLNIRVYQVFEKIYESMNHKMFEYFCISLYAQEIVTNNQ